MRAGVLSNAQWCALYLCRWKSICLSLILIRAALGEQSWQKYAGQSKMQRAVSEDISATLPMTPAQWRTEVLIKITFWSRWLPGGCTMMFRQTIWHFGCWTGSPHSNTPTHTCVATQWKRLGTCRRSRMRHCSYNNCQVGQWTPCDRHVVDGVHICPIMHRNRAVNALWSTCSRRRSHQSDNA